MAETALRDAGIRHSIYLQRYGTSVIKRIIALLNRTDSDLVDKLRTRLDKIAGEGFDTGPDSTKRLQALLNEVRSLNKAAYDLVAAELTDELKAFSQLEANWQVGTLKGLLPDGVSVIAPSPRTVVASALSRPFQGRLLKEWLDGLEASRAARVRDAIRIGLVEGQSIEQIVRRIRGSKAMGYADGLLEMDRRGLQAMVRTAVTHISSSARDTVFDDNEDIVESVRWVSTLDSRTTPICQSRDGKVFPVGKGPRPPAHIGCRSATVPVLNDKFAFLSAGRTRASENGPVSADLSYNDWLKTQSAKFQDEVLGADKGALFRTGGLKLDKFVDSSGKSLTLEQLQAAEPVAYQKAGLNNPIRPPRGTPQDAVARFLASPPAQQQMLETLFGGGYKREMSAVRRIKAEQAWKASDESLGGVRYYTGEGYRGINKRMRESGGTLQDRQFTALTSSALPGMTRFESEIWRAPTKTAAHADQRWAGAVVGGEYDMGNQLQSFSGSLTYLTQSNWSRGTNLLLRIAEPKAGAYIDPVSLNKGEHEVLLPPGLKYRVVDKTIKRIGDADYRVIDLEIVGDE